MRKLYLIALVCMLAACSSQRFQANFPTAHTYSGYERGQTVAKQQVTTSTAQAEIRLASTETVPSETIQPVEVPSATTIEGVRKTYLQMDKAQRKAFRKEVKSELKEYAKAMKEKAPVASKAQAIDHDLKLAAIFGAVGVVALIISGDVFWIIGGIAMIIGVVFFVKWLIRQ